MQDVQVHLITMENTPQVQFNTLYSKFLKTCTIAFKKKNVYIKFIKIIYVTGYY